MDNTLFQIAFLFLAATIAGFVVRVFRQPILPFFILAGLIAGPILHLIAPSPTILALSEAGIAFLLFIVGTEINFGKSIKGSKVILYATIVGLIQIGLFLLIGFSLGRLFNLATLPSFYIALAVTFSSTMLVVKFLSDSGEILTIHGKISLAILLLQDIFAIVALGFITSLGRFSFSFLSNIFLKIILLLVIAYILNKIVYPKLFKFAAKSEELLFLSTVSVVLGFGILSQVLGLNIAIGAFIAGISLANLDYSFEMASLVRPLRDFFATLFFVTLGLLIIPAAIKENIFLIVTIVLIAVILKPIFIFIFLNLARFKAISSLKASLFLGQISEFVLIIAGLGLALGQINAEFLSVLVTSLVITTIISAYFISYSRFFIDKLNHVAKNIELKNSLTYERLPKKLRNHAIVFGYHRTGEKIVATLKKMGKQFLVVDFNPDLIDELHRHRIHHLYGDMGDKEILDKAEIGHAKIIISTIPDLKQNLMMIERARTANPSVSIYVTAKEVEEAIELYNEGANYVILPHYLGGQHTSLLIERFSGDEDKLLKIKEEHLKELKKDLKRHGK